jgi:ABC-type antimicrobial peptide transport system permease subunit
MSPWDGQGFADGSESMVVGLNSVAPGYFETLGMQIVGGRPFAPGDGAGAPPVIVVNETFARRAFPTGDALGQVVPMERSGYSGFTIVGIAKDATYYSFGELPQVQVFFAMGQVPQGRFALIVRTADDPLTHTNAVVRTINGLDPSLPVGRVETLESLYAGELAGYRTSANVVGLAGLIALLLAGVGLFGVMMFRVGQQTREIGVRMALGATTRRVARGVLARGLRLTAIGAVVGVAGSLALGRFIEGMLFSVPALDPISLILAPLVLILVATTAILIPARRAMRIDPMGAIRTE